MQLQLDLIGGHHAGPLFIVRKRRAPRLVNAFDGSRRIWGMVRRASERKATPCWADKDLIRALFKLARIYTETLGERYSVDHMVPLSNPIVCGLHVGDNLCSLLRARCGILAQLLRLGLEGRVVLRRVLLQTIGRVLAADAGEQGDHADTEEAEAEDCHSGDWSGHGRSLRWEAAVESFESVEAPTGRRFCATKSQFTSFQKPETYAARSLRWSM